MSRVYGTARPVTGDEIGDTSFAPIHGSRLDGEPLAMLAVSEDQVKNAPDIDTDAHISQSEQDALRPVLPRLSWHRRVDQRSPGRRADATRGRQPGSQGVAPSIELRHYLLPTTARLGELATRSRINASSANPAEAGGEGAARQQPPRP